jgi:hypothetical protein
MMFSEEKLLRKVFPQTPFQKIFLENLFEKRFSNFPKTFGKMIVLSARQVFVALIRSS